MENKKFLVSVATSTSFVALALLVMIMSGCIYRPIHGTVKDSASGRPIEGALVVAQWTKKHGFGLTYHELYKFTETLTDKEGNFALDGVYDPFVEPPQMIIYKEGYIPWRNDYVFPSTNLLKNNKWENNVTYSLSPFSYKYNYSELCTFLNAGIMGGGTKDTPYFNAVNQRLSFHRNIENNKN